MSENIPTTEKIARALEEANAPQTMIDRARAGYYDDYKSELALPIMQLIHDAEMCRLPTIARRARNGEFDATKEEADAWARSADGRAAYQEFGHLLQDVKKYDRKKRKSDGR